MIAKKKNKKKNVFFLFFFSFFLVCPVCYVALMSADADKESIGRGLAPLYKRSLISIVEKKGSTSNHMFREQWIFKRLWLKKENMEKEEVE
jgi:hypothetical protein